VPPRLRDGGVEDCAHQKAHGESAEVGKAVDRVWTKGSARHFTCCKFQKLPRKCGSTWSDWVKRDEAAGMGKLTRTCSLLLCRSGTQWRGGMPGERCERVAWDMCR
jgi:hypothetical protein